MQIIPAEIILPVYPFPAAHSEIQKIRLLMSRIIIIIIINNSSICIIIYITIATSKQPLQIKSAQNLHLLGACDIECFKSMMRA